MTVRDAESTVERGRALARAGRTDAALEVLASASERLTGDDDPDAVRVVGFAWLNRIDLLVGADRLDEAVADARELLAVTQRADDGPVLAGLATMLLDVALWLLARRRDADALHICEAVVARLSDGCRSAERSIVAGARFLAAQAYVRVGRGGDARVEIEALCAIGEPALAALDRLARRSGGQRLGPSWDAQIAATSVTVLWRLDRSAEASALAGQAGESLAAHGHESLAGTLRALQREIATDS